MKQKKRTLFSPITSPIAFSLPTPICLSLAVRLCRSVRLFLSLSGGEGEGR